MEYEYYEDVIDAYEAGIGVEEGDSLTDYIRKNNIKIKKIEPFRTESKADGGAIGIEVLFTDKMANGGRVPMVSGGALKAIGSGIMKMFSKGDDVVDLAKQEEIFRSGNITTEFLENVDDKVIKKFISTRDAKGVGGYGLYDNFDDMPNGLKAAELISRIKNAEGGINYEAAELFIGKKLKGNETVNELIKMVITEKKADGGRVGLFMGGPALEGQALSIYNSMNMTGATDKEIADRLTSLGLYDPNASTPDTPNTTPSRPLGLQGDEQDVGYVDRQDYSFNKKNYEPGKQLEINPAAFGMSFPAQPKGPKREGIINQAIDSFTSLPTRSLSSFVSPTTGGNIVGPAEQGFMEQTLNIDPAGRTREEIRSLYDNYNRFLGRTSNYADARVKGKAGQMFGTLVGAASGIPFLGKGIDMFTNALGPKGNASDRSLYAVDNVGFGQGTQRDEFGVFTGGKTLFGDTTSYGERIAERLGELDDFFGSRIEGFDINNLDPATLSKMKGINSFYAKQVQAYQQRLERERINKAAELEKQRQEYLESQTRKEVQDLQKEIDSGKYSGGSDFAQSNQAAVGGGEKGRAANTDNDKSTGTSQGYSQHYARGGLASMFTRRR